MNGGHHVPLARAVCLVAVALSSCGRPVEAPREAKPPEVTVSLPVQRQVTDYAEFTGRTEAVDTVDVRARVSGYLTGIRFTPGDPVKKDEILFEIDRRMYDAVLKQAQAEVASAQAHLAQKEADLARAEELLPKKAISRADYDKAVADKAVAEASVEAAKAAVERAQLDVDYTSVTSPMDGVVSRNLISVGNLVTADATTLTSIVAVDPLYAYFDVDERTLLRFQRMVREGKVPRRGSGDPEIQMALADEAGFPHVGWIDFVEPRLNPSTGTLQLRAVFPNPQLADGDRELSAGLFVRLRLPLGPPRDALLVPEEAIGTDQGQKYLIVVDSKDLAQYRRVELGSPEGDLRAITSGIEAGDRVVVKGLQRARPGSPVTPTLQPAAEKPVSAEKPPAAEESPPAEQPPAESSQP